MTLYTEADWKANLVWLDTSGLALYLLDRLTQLRCEWILPSAILERLQQNLRDNRRKNAASRTEAEAINHGLQQAGVLFAHLKGITLTPAAVPDPALRVQLDLDLLVHEADAAAAAAVLESLGYTRACISGDTWEFKAGGDRIPSLNDLYKPKTQRAAELHLASRDGLLARVVQRPFGNTVMPALSPVDLYLQQALHLFKHLCSSFTRAAWLLEYRQHMLTHREDASFWPILQALAAQEPKAEMALGAVSLLVREVFGDPLPAYLDGLVTHALSAPVRLWVQRYGRAALLADFPGTKLYLLLQAELESSPVPPRRSLLPLALPPRITLGSPHEGLRSKLRRSKIQASYILLRLRFHGVEGTRYCMESLRFRRLVAGLTP